MDEEDILPPFSVLIPAYNEEKSIAKCIDSMLLQTVMPQRVILINDGSTDSTLQIMRLYEEIFPEKIVVVDIKKNTGNKALALRKAIPYIEGEVVFFTDADSELEPNAFEYMIHHFLDPEVGGVCGYVKSRKYNAITGIRELQYILGQGVHKKGEAVLDVVLVIPGSVGAVRRELFNPVADTVTDDMDLTLPILEEGYEIIYENRAIAWTSDPPNFRSYINQTVRWFSGFFQNMKKHLLRLPRRAKILIAIFSIESALYLVILDLVLVYGILFWDFAPFLVLIGTEMIPWLTISLYAVFKRKRKDLIKSAFLMPLAKLLDLHLWFYCLVKEVLLGKREKVWRRADRIKAARNLT